MRSEKFFWPVLWILAAAVIAAHVRAAGSGLGPLWGVDAYAFLPPAALIVACVGFGLAILLAWVARGSLDRALLGLAARLQAPAPIPGARAAGTRAPTAGLLPVVAAAAFFIMFWVFRAGHTLLGDGNPLTDDLPLGVRFHPDQPLTYFIQHVFYGLARGLFETTGGDPAEVARGTVGLSSAIAGAIFVPVAWGLARELARSVAVDPSDDCAATSRSVVPLAFAMLLAQGYVQLFFGYVEHYTIVTVTIGLYLMLSLRCVRGAAPLALPGAVLVLAISLHLSAVLLVPSFLVLLAKTAATPGLRSRGLRDLAIIAVAGSGISALLGSIERGYNLFAATIKIVVQAVQGPDHRAEPWAYMFSPEHIQDFLNEQTLIGPAAAALFLAGLVWLVLERPILAWANLFLIAAGLVSLGGAWVTTDLSLGYPRDWDLFAPSALVFTTAGLGIVFASRWRGMELRRWLFVLVSLSLLHTVPWIAVNTSFERSFERFKTLPLGRGRTEAVVGVWYMTHGDTVQAARWFEQSLRANPANNVAAFSLGRIARNAGDYAWAVRAFWAAVQVRPDVAAYRFSLVDAIVRAGGRGELAKPHLDTLRMRDPREPTYWAGSGAVWVSLGEPDSAIAAFERARQLAPLDTSLVALLSAARRRDQARPLIDDWSRIMGPGIPGDNAAAAPRSDVR